MPQYVVYARPYDDADEAWRSWERDTVGIEGEWGGGIALPSRLGSLGSVVSSPRAQRGRDGAPTENEFGSF